MASPIAFVALMAAMRRRNAATASPRPDLVTARPFPYEFNYVPILFSLRQESSRTWNAPLIKRQSGLAQPRGIW
jgi:hypothetical protein